MKQAETNATPTSAPPPMRRGLITAQSTAFDVLNAKAMIPAGQSIEALLEDAGGLIDEANQLIIDMAMVPGSAKQGRLFAVHYLLRFAQGMNRAAIHGVASAAEPVPDGKRPSRPKPTAADSSP